MIEHREINSIVNWLEGEVEDMRREVANDHRIDEAWDRGHLNGRFDKMEEILKVIKKLIACPDCGEELKLSFDFYAWYCNECSFEASV
jgi:hypothetical protein